MITAPVTFTKINTEFDRPLSTPLSAYAGYRVFDNVLNRNVNLPTSPLKFSDFLNKGKAFVSIQPPVITITTQPTDRNTFFDIGLVSFNVAFTMTRADYPSTGELIPNRVRTGVVWEQSQDNGATWTVVKTEPELTSKNATFSSTLFVDTISANNNNLYRVKITSRDIYYDDVTGFETDLLTTIRTSNTAKLILTVPVSSPICLNVATLSNRTIYIKRDQNNNLLSSGSGKLTFSNLAFCEVIGDPSPDIIDTGWLMVNQPWFPPVYDFDFGGLFGDSTSTTSADWWNPTGMFDNSKSSFTTHAQPTSGIKTTNAEGYRVGVDASEIIGYGFRVLGRAMRYRETRLTFINNQQGTPLPPSPTTIGAQYLGFPGNEASAANQPRLVTATLNPGYAAWVSGAATANTATQQDGWYSTIGGFTLAGTTEAGYNSLTGNDPQVLEWWKQPAFRFTGSGMFGVQGSQVYYLEIRILYRPKQ